MLHIFHGPDEFSQQEAVEKLKQEIGSEQLGDVNTVAFEGARLTLDQLRNACSALPFFAEKRLVVISGLLSRFEPKRGRTDEPAGAPGPRTKGGADAAAFAELLLALPEVNEIVLTEGQTIREANPLLKLLRTKTRIRVFGALGGDDLREWIADRFRQKGGSASREAVHKLASLVEANMRTLDGEVEKLVTYAAGRRVEAPDVDLLVAESHQETVFQLTDALLEGEQDRALTLVRDLITAGSVPPQLLFMIARQFRHLLLAKDTSAAEAGASPALLRAHGLSDWALAKNRDLARRYSWSQLEEIYKKLLEADVLSKTGRMDPGIALELLIVDLCAMSRRPPGGPAPARRDRYRR